MLGQGRNREKVLAEVGNVENVTERYGRAVGEGKDDGPGCDAENGRVVADDNGCGWGDVNERRGGEEVLETCHVGRSASVDTPAAAVERRRTRAISRVGSMEHECVCMAGRGKKTTASGSGSLS